MDHVIRAIVQSVPGIGNHRATEIMFEAHFYGVALVTSAPLELAELYRDRLQTFGLTATIERGD
ncbi:MAG: ATP-dependent Clp protease adaptor ClpS [Chloroflexi bacterium]|nr:ATP-dependent Clp protease adaptor ClpS [Chloroflexota bacterium]